ncbi:MAG: glycosyltransferase [Candidatus Lokiarchaeota archaeon]|nr:glycosyltransferase [Candidatus Lokiarchaeota archaeon]
MSDPLKLLMYNPLSTRMGGGGDRWLAEVIPRLVGKGINVTLMTTSFIPKSYRATSTKDHVERIIQAGARYIEIPCSSVFERINHPMLSGQSLLALSGAIRKHDCVYFLNAYAFQDMLVNLATIIAPGVPVISAQHASMFQGQILKDTYTKTISRALLECFDAFHVLNREDYETYKKWGLDKVFLIPNGVDVDWFSPAKSEKTNDFQVLSVGRLDQQKGIDVLIQAITLLNQELDESLRPRFRICGTGPLAEKVDEFAQRTHNVSYLGFVGEKELLRRYRRADLFVMPSKRETFGLVAMEAMSCGVPVITSDIPGPRTFVERDYGMMVPPSNPRALAKAIQRFYTLWKEKPDAYKKMGELAREKCVKEYNWNRIVDRLTKMIQTVSEF